MCVFFRAIEAAYSTTLADILKYTEEHLEVFGMMVNTLLVVGAQGIALYAVRGIMVKTADHK